MEDDKIYEIYGYNDMIYSGNPQMSFFGSYNQYVKPTHCDGYSVYSYKHNNNIVEDEVLDGRHSNFSKSCVSVVGNDKNNKFDISHLLKKYDILSGIVVKCNKNLFYENKIKFNLRLDEITICLTVNQILIYDKLFEKIINEDDQYISINLPFGFFRNSYKNLILYKSLDIEFEILFLESTINGFIDIRENIYDFEIDFFPIFLDTEERINLYNMYDKRRSQLIEVFEEHTFKISENNNIVDLDNDFQCAIKEFFWFYTDKENNKLDIIDSVELHIDDQKHHKNILLKKHQCTVSNHLFHHNNTYKNIYLYSFALKPKNIQSTGEFLPRETTKIFLKTHKNSNDISEMYITVETFKVKRITFYDNFYKIKCIYGHMTHA